MVCEVGTSQVFSKKRKGVPGWLCRLSSNLAQVMISRIMSLSPASGSVLTAQSLEPRAWTLEPGTGILDWIPCLPLSPHLPHSHSVSFSLKNK